MTATTRIPGQDGGQPTPGQIDVTNLQQVVLSLVGSESDGDTLLRKLLSVLVGLSGARAGANYNRKESENAAQLMHRMWPEELVAAIPELPDALGQLATEVMSSGLARAMSLKGISRSTSTDRWVAIGAPVLGQDRALAAMSLVLDLPVGMRPEPYLAILQSVAACFQIHVLRRLGGAHQVLSQQMSVVLDAVGRSVTARNATEMCYFLANELQRHLGCHQVAIGWWARGKANVVALSGQARFEKRSDLARAIIEAMSESVRQERSVSARRTGDEPSESEGLRPIDLAHRRLLELQGADRIITHPLRSGDAIVGAWVFQWMADHPPTPADERLVAVATGQIGPVLDWARRADQGVLRRATRSVGDVMSAAVGPKHLVAKMVVVLIASVLATMIFWKVPFRVGGECVLQATPRRYITARFDGVLKQAYVRPGEVVAKGKILAELEDYQLKNEWGMAKAQWHKASKEADSYWSKGKIAEAQMSRLDAEKSQAQIDLLEFNLQHVKIMAPIDGVILSGDLERAMGVPVQKGQVLFELAPLAEMTLEVAVPDADAGSVSSGQKGEFALQARPEQTVEFSVERVRPQAEVHNEKNTFIAEGPVKNQEGWLRPGMEGTAKIEVGRRALGWVLTRRAVAWFQMTFWW